MTSVRQFAKWSGIGLILEEYVGPTPARAQPHPLPEGMAGVVQMCEAAYTPHHALLVALGAGAGCRVSESRTIRKEDVSITDMMLTIRGKGDKTRYVPISQKYLMPWLTPVYLASDGGVLIDMCDREARGMITRLGVRAGLTRPVASHDLRATFGTHIYNQTKDLRLVQELMGHASPETTAIYTQVTMNAMRRAVDL